jgi:preprotein translocase subunit SecF
VNLHRAIAVYRGQRVPTFRLIEHRRRWFLFSGAIVALSLVGLVVGGLAYSIDFVGGAQVTVPLARRVSVQQITSLLAERGLDQAEVQIVDGRAASIRTGSLSDEGRDAEAILEDLARLAGVDRADISVEDVGPTWGSEISRKAIQGLVIVLGLILLYIAYRFEWAMGIAAIVALVHDIVVTAGIYALVGRPVTPETVIAVLTIMGFSLYDTVVIFDKVQENLESPTLIGRYGYDGVVNLSLNTVLMRSVNTSLVVLLPITAMLLFGGETLKDFAFAMLVGTAAGTYSSIFVAAPLLTVLKARSERVRVVERRRARDRRPVPAGAATSADERTPEPEARPASPRSRRSASKRRPPAKRRRR